MVCGYNYVLWDKDFKYNIVGLLRLTSPSFLKMAVVNTNVTISQNNVTMNSNVYDT